MILEETKRKLVGDSENGSFYTENTLTRVVNYFLVITYLMSLACHKKSYLMCVEFSNFQNIT